MSEVDAIISELSGASQLTIDMWTDDKAVVSESAIGRQRQFERLGLATFGRQTEVVRWSDSRAGETAGDGALGAQRGAGVRRRDRAGGKRRRRALDAGAAFARATPAAPVIAKAE